MMYCIYRADNDSDPISSSITYYFLKFFIPDMCCWCLDNNNNNNNNNDGGSVFSFFALFIVLLLSPGIIIIIIFCRLHFGWSAKSKQIDSPTKRPQQRVATSVEPITQEEHERVVQVIQRAEEITVNEQRRIGYRIVHSSVYPTYIYTLYNIDCWICNREIRFGRV